MVCFVASFHLHGQYAENLHYELTLNLPTKGVGQRRLQANIKQVFGEKVEIWKVNSKNYIPRIIEPES
ncbi:hypothetical protein ACTXT7_000804 [Hymenolepis weldensis]